MFKQADIERRQLLWDRIRKNPTTTYFLVKSFAEDHINIAKSTSLWATGRRNEQVLSEAFDTSRFVVLLFSVNCSGHFFGWALMTNKPGYTQTGSIFKTADGRPFPGKDFKIEWMSKRKLPFNLFDGIVNERNGGKPVKIGRDGQQLSERCGAAVLSVYGRCEWSNETFPDEAEGTDLATAGNFLTQQGNFLTREGDGTAGMWDGHNSAGHSGVGHAHAGVGHPHGSVSAGAHLSAGGPPRVQYPLTWDELLQVNPSLAIFPVDLTKLTFDGYQALYSQSQKEMPRHRSFVPSLDAINGYQDWTPDLLMELGLESEQQLVELLAETASNN